MTTFRPSAIYFLLIPLLLFAALPSLAYACLEDDECPGSAVCDPLLLECVPDTGDGSTSLGGACTRSEQCEGSAVCDPLLQQCVPDIRDGSTSLGGSCTRSEQCKSSLVCTGGVCKAATPAVGAVNPSQAGAANTNTSNSTSGSGLQNPLKVDNLQDFLKTILAGIVEIGSIFLVLMLVYVGFLFVIARGNPEKIQTARSALVWTVIGGLLLLGAEAISLVIQSTVSTL